MRRLWCNDDLPTGDTDTPYYNLSHTNGALPTPLRNIVCPSHHRQEDISALHPHEVLLLRQVASALVLWTGGKKEVLSSIIPPLYVRNTYAACIIDRARPTSHMIGFYERWYGCQPQGATLMLLSPSQRSIAQRWNSRLKSGSYLVTSCRFPWFTSASPDRQNGA
jgi:hypothetical protein